ncbi:butyrophilin-like protein 10 [Clinocottus analis]|uniref:butyrophilin-like protein 10 n=1 Tax=Clinocottus analis TaxID=304258 RepID=UPI0035C03732
MSVKTLASIGSMRTFLGVLLVVVVSGDDRTVLGVLEDSVLLPCSCLELDEEFKWQMMEPQQMLMYKYNKTMSNRYEGRIKAFHTENSNNCSVLLTNVTAEDQGTYRCIFHSEDTYQTSNVYLKVSASYSVCQTTSSLSGGVKVFQCDVSGRHREAWIQWSLHGQPLTNLTGTKITHTNCTDALTGLYHFNSTLTTKHNWTSEPTCDVKTEHISTTFSSDCGKTHAKYKENPNSPQDVRFWMKIIVVGMFGLVLLLLLLWCLSPSSLRTRGGTSNIV